MFTRIPETTRSGDGERVEVASIAVVLLPVAGLPEASNSFRLGPESVVTVTRMSPVPAVPLGRVNCALWVPEVAPTPRLAFPGTDIEPRKVRLLSALTFWMST